LASAKSVLIELNDRFVEQAVTCRRLLTEAGLVLSSAGRDDGGTHNEIWRRS
jgi:hypothetical protein